MQPDDNVLIQIAGRWVGESGLDSQKEGNTRRGSTSAAQEGCVDKIRERSTCQELL